MTNLQSQIAIFATFGFLLLSLASTGCQVLRPEQTPTVGVAVSPTPRPARTLILPTPPPGATLTAMVEAYRRTRAPASEALPTDTPIPPQAQEPAVTDTPTPLYGPSIHVVPEITEPGAFVEVRGTGWQPAKEIAIGLGTAIEDARFTDARGTARADGSFAATLSVPAGWTDQDAVIVAQSMDGQLRAVTRLYLVVPTQTVPPTASPTPLPTTTPTPAFQGWRGEYYDNVDLVGDPLWVRDDSTIDFDWGQGAPATDLPADTFSVRWTRRIDFLPGGYQFDVQVDDGVRVFIDDQLVLDEWKVAPPTSYEFQQVLDGPTEVRVEYFDAGGNATIRFQWYYMGRYPNWRGAYYNNRALSGTPVLVRDDVAVNFNWGDESPSPQISPDNFSARWTRTAQLSQGTYRFHAQADDGVRVWVDDRLIINEWHTSTGERDYVADTFLSRGSHDIRIEYYETGGKAEVHLWWENLSAYAHWRGAYFDNRSLSGQPAFVRDDVTISFDWGEDGPGDIGPDNFSVTWMDRWGSDTAWYRFFAEHDDGVRVWVDSRLVIDEWYETGRVTHRGDVELTAGSHEIRVDYFEASGDASIRVWWEQTSYR